MIQIILLLVLFMVTLTASVVAIPIVMFPVLKRHNERLALGYVGARIFEGFFDIVVYGIAPLLLLTLSLEFVEAGAPVDSYFQTSDFELCIVSIGTRSSMVISLGSCWRRIDISNGVVETVRLSRDLFGYSNNIE